MKKNIFIFIMIANCTIAQGSVKEMSKLELTLKINDMEKNLNKNITEFSQHHNKTQAQLEKNNLSLDDFQTRITNIENYLKNTPQLITAMSEVSLKISEMQAKEDFMFDDLSKKTSEMQVKANFEIKKLSNIISEMQVKEKFEFDELSKHKTEMMSKLTELVEFLDKGRVTKEEVADLRSMIMTMPKLAPEIDNINTRLDSKFEELSQHATAVTTQLDALKSSFIKSSQHATAVTTQLATLESLHKEGLTKEEVTNIRNILQAHDASAKNYKINARRLKTLLQITSVAVSAGTVVYLARTQKCKDWKDRACTFAHGLLSNPFSRTQIIPATIETPPTNPS